MSMCIVEAFGFEKAEPVEDGRAENPTTMTIDECLKRSR